MRIVFANLQSKFMQQYRNLHKILIKILSQDYNTTKVCYVWASIVVDANPIRNKYAKCTGKCGLKILIVQFEGLTL